MCVGLFCLLAANTFRFIPPLVINKLTTKKSFNNIFTPVTVYHTFFGGYVFLPRESYQKTILQEISLELSHTMSKRVFVAKAFRLPPFVQQHAIDNLISSLLTLFSYLKERTQLGQSKFHFYYSCKLFLTTTELASSILLYFCIPFTQKKIHFIDIVAVIHSLLGPVGCCNNQIEAMFLAITLYQPKILECFRLLHKTLQSETSTKKLLLFLESTYS